MLLVSALLGDAAEARYADRRHDPVAVTYADASKRAAAVQAAYAILVARFPAQETGLTAKRTASLDAIGSGESVERGVAWGQDVAEAILAWRSTDGFTPAPSPFTGSTDTGVWRPTPPAKRTSPPINRSFSREKKQTLPGQCPGTSRISKLIPRKSRDGVASMSRSGSTGSISKPKPKSRKKFGSAIMGALSG